VKKIANIPSKYLILDYLLEFHTDYYNPEIEILLLSPINRDVNQWYTEFEQRILSAIEQRDFTPVLRASDGEYLFLLGPQPPSPREKIKDITLVYLKYYHLLWLEKIKGFSGQTAPGVSVGRYSAKELKQGRKIFAEGLLYVMQHGQLAAHLQFAPKPFQEHYHYAFKRFLDDRRAELTADNYVPFYFVYLFLSRVATAGMLKGKRILFINGASEEKRRAIDARFEQYGVHETRWIGLSKDRSLFDRVELSVEDLRSDICILGGGVGKFNLIQQLSGFQGPVIDAGYYFEAWANPEIAHKRRLCIV
jgi:hypothetical protein